ncbi:hypothetical protein F4V57_08050 [Acinetobacter qingfengensis]|uniref:DUF4377 domain-containing protein n=1 Tax=Acinetobacter qingfengensis TaxID=1262585 RepID=A0A1E7R5E1_9GAMM|nr:hypothetical protein [Acinetobacter qingfengensis]KAA8733173.1 hypothetical protein F4V57_08050 [Acinetobacter qingfengensis]OEY94550.1 hypothetical protein BJI46_13530 [Acinetobacter qingfengensis]
MMRVAYFTAFMLGLMSLMAGCQSTQQVVNSYKLLQPRSATNLETTYLSCASSIACEFARVDDVLVINENTHWPTKDAIERGLLRLEGSLFSRHHQYGLSLIPGEHEVVVRFYPVTNERMESFHLIHKFMAGQTYKLAMYRQKIQGNRSLLNVAIPGPLCVDLLQNDVVLRRFCRPFDAMTGMGEFVEQKV